ncbi:MAG: glycosyltransferase [Candidatus Shapirobacteria bacterium]
MKIKKILVLTDTMPWGHRSIARSIYNYLKPKEKENGWKVEYVEVKSDLGIGADLYTWTYRTMPRSNRWAYKLAVESQTAREYLNNLSKMGLPKIRSVIAKYRPDLVISAYFFHSQTLGKMKGEGKYEFKLWTVVADPWSVNPVSFVENADMHLVYDEVGENMAGDYGITKDKVLKTGWWVREQMYQKFTKLQIANYKKKLGFEDDRPVIFVGGGSLGNNVLPKILPMLLMVDRKVGFVFNAGTDKFAYNLVEQYQKLLKGVRKDNLIQIKNLGWIENMAEVLAGCDMVFGKAGPNFLFDCMACEKPFVAITHIGGQEDGNLEIILEKKLGWVKEKNLDLFRFLLRYLEYPKLYEEKYMKNIKDEATKNKSSLKKIEEGIIKYLP